MNNMLRRFVQLRKPKDAFFLDEENAIIVLSRKDAPGDVSVHVRAVGTKIKEIKRWNEELYYFNSNHAARIIPELHLLKVQNSSGGIGALYDYAKGKFVVPQGVWSEIMLQYKGVNINFMEKYDCFVARLTICSDPIDEDDQTFISPVTGESIARFFHIKRDYFAILNFDGSIRCNTLFMGDDLGRVRKTIDLNWYDSLDDFKKVRKAQLNLERDKKIAAYRRLVRLTGSTSPYKDDEVLKVLEFKPKEDSKPNA